MNTRIATILILAAFATGFTIHQYLPGRSVARLEATNDSTPRLPESSAINSETIIPAETSNSPIGDEPEPSITNVPVIQETQPGFREQPEESPDLRAIQAANAPQIELWKKRLAELVAHFGDQAKAVGQLAVELDRSYQGLVASDLEKLVEMSGVERLDYLTALESEIQGGVHAVFRSLGVGKVHPQLALAGSLEAVAAEMQYGDLELSNAQRVELMKLDEERVTRLNGLFATTGIGAEADQLAQLEIDPWYESRVRSIFGIELEAE